MKHVVAAVDTSRTLGCDHRSRGGCFVVADDYTGAARHGGGQRGQSERAAERHHHEHHIVWSVAEPDRCIVCMICDRTLSVQHELRTAGGARRGEDDVRVVGGTDRIDRWTGAPRLRTVREVDGSCAPCAESVRRPRHRCIAVLTDTATKPAGCARQQQTDVVSVVRQPGRQPVATTDTVLLQPGGDSAAFVDELTCCDLVAVIEPGRSPSTRRTVAAHRPRWSVSHARSHGMMADMFLGEDLILWLLLALGGALFAGNLLALLKPMEKRSGRVPPRTRSGRSQPAVRRPRPDRRGLGAGLADRRLSSLAVSPVRSERP